MSPTSPRIQPAMQALSLTLLLVATSTAGCGEDDAKAPTPDVSEVSDTAAHADAEDASPVDTSPPLDTDPPEEVTPRANSFSYAADMVGSNGQACTDQCAMKRVAGDNLELAVVYRDPDGRPIVDRIIYWDTGNAPTDLANLSSLSTFTDAQGRAQVSLRSGGLAGSATITATVSGDDSVSPRPFVVTFDPPPQPDLVASFEYLGRHPLATFSLNLYRQTAGQPGCASVHPDAPPITPTLTLGPFSVGRQARVQTLPGLVAGVEERWVVQLVGPAVDDQQSPALAVGCVEDVLVRRGQTAQAMVYILDLPPHFRGTYQTLTRIDSLSGAEGTTIGNTLITLTQLFTAPGNLIVTWACQGSPSGALGTVCYWITNSQGQPNFAGSLIVDAANAALLALLREVIGDNAQTASQIVSEMLRDLRLVSVMTFAREPATSRGTFAGAYFAPGDASEEWTHVRFRWKFDPNCKDSPNPADCGWDQVPLEQIYGQRPSAPLEAAVDVDGALHVTPHAVPKLTYGPLINFLVERRILPLVFAGGGTEPVDSWDDFIATLFGDRICLDYDDCCEFFADKLEDTLAGTFASFDTRVLACELAIPIVAGVIRNQLTRLDGALHLGTFADAPCMSRDSDSDRWVDGFGTQSDLCAWDLWFPTSGQRFEPDNDWLSVRR